ncbi:hypothetical protein A4R35_15610 [Thermogemmatispora tikiterensis]|uniref:Uncharacterized protein n=1 Tax=Thermogemmatispora tikiterensis TaxID=1825093 RepID=A0A328VP93_9CHLR|nr:hypothetical protein A4R35_15610 [Thermogemmatispora tikiterensis]
MSLEYAMIAIVNQRGQVGPPSFLPVPLSAWISGQGMPGLTSTLVHLLYRVARLFMFHLIYGKAPLEATRLRLTIKPPGRYNRAGRQEQVDRSAFLPRIKEG